MCLCLLCRQLKQTREYLGVSPHKVIPEDTPLRCKTFFFKHSCKAGIQMIMQK